MVGRRLLSALFVTVLAAGCEREPVASTTPQLALPLRSGRIHVLVIANTDIRDIPLGLAVDDLRTQGYSVEVTPLLGGALMADALRRGEAEIGSFNNETLWTAITKGLRAKTLMTRLNFPNLLVAKQGVKDCAALNGRPMTLGSQVGLNPRLVALYFERKCPGTKPQLMVMPDSLARTAALTTGAADAALVPFEELVKLQQRSPGRFFTMVDLSKEFPLLQVNGLHARTEWLEQNPEAARDFIRAILVAHRRVIADPQIMYVKVVEQLKVDLDTAKTLVDASLAAQAWDPNGALTHENVQYTLDFLRGIQAIPETLRFDDVADLSYLNAVLAEIGRTS